MYRGGERGISVVGLWKGDKRPAHLYRGSNSHAKDPGWFAGGQRNKDANTTRQSTITSAIGPLLWKIAQCFSCWDISRCGRSRVEKHEDEAGAAPSC